MKSIIITLLIGYLMTACNPATRSAGKDHSAENEQILLGNLQYEQIINTLPRWQDSHQSVELNKEQLGALANIDQPIEIICYLGTWCGDSRRGVPPFEQALQQAPNPNISIRYIGVDRDKLDPELTAPEMEIERVPTYLIMQDGQEIARLIETPVGENFLADFLELFEN